MSSQTLKAQLLAICLCVLSISGTLALFSSVPLIAQLISSLNRPAHLQSMRLDSL